MLFLVHIHHDLPNQNVYDPLLQAHVRGGSIPDCREILRQTQQHFLGRDRHGLWVARQCLQLLLQISHLLQSCIPARLQFRSN